MGLDEPLSPCERPNWVPLFAFLGALAALCAIPLSNASAQAPVGMVQVRFVESAPADTFLFTNTGDCDLGRSEVWLDLRPSIAGLVFDVSDGGAGLDRFHRLEITEGGEFIHRVSKLKDGSTALHFQLERLPVGGTIAFKADIDDTLSPEDSRGGNTQVFESELEGVHFKVNDVSVLFAAQASATAVGLDCMTEPS